MKFTKFKNAVEMLYERHKEQDAYLDKLVCPFDQLMYDNEYSNAAMLMVDYFIKEYFGPLAEEVFTFLYEAKPYKVHVPDKDKVFEITEDISTFLEYMSQTYSFE